jgi:hypothetical protein
MRQPRSTSRDAGALSKRTSASAAKTKELNKPHNFLRRSNSSLTRASILSSKKTKIDPTPKKFEQKIISKSSIPSNIHQRTQRDEEPEPDTDYMKETA